MPAIWAGDLCWLASAATTRAWRGREPPPWRAPDRAAGGGRRQPRRAAGRPRPCITKIALADIGFKDGIRLANLGARREIFVPLPQGTDLKLTELTLDL